jgi:protein TonB
VKKHIQYGCIAVMLITAQAIYGQVATSTGIDQPHVSNDAKTSQGLATLVQEVKRRRAEYHPQLLPETSAESRKELEQYVDRWAQRVQRVGARSYLSLAPRERPHGVVVVTAEIHRDGTLGSVFIDHSSGSEVLDSAAIKAVKDASPFEPVPETGTKVDLFRLSRSFIYENQSAKVGP